MMLMATSKSSAKTSLNNLEETLNGYFVKKAPFQIPGDVKEIFVKVIPWLIVIGLVFQFLFLGIGTLLAPFALLGGMGSLALLVSGVANILAMVLAVMALPALFKRKKSGWKLMYYTSLISLVGSLVSITSANLMGNLLMVLLSWYVLFQIRSMYK